ncbi:MAG TPA: cation transporter [Clostridiaceae bacterium]|nr:cation transporter [Clostridiaceae bacterium]
MKTKSGENTLLASVLLSSPGPAVLGVGLMLGKSSTQLADFIRRTAELAAIIISWYIFRATNKDDEENAIKKAKLEGIANYCVGLAMCLSGIVMILIALLSGHAEKGNVILGLVIAILGATTNSWFWFRYRRLDKAGPNAILAVQSKLYRAKSLVDICVCAALASILILPGSVVSYYMDIAGSVVVAMYLLISGAIILFRRKPDETCTIE